MIARALGGETPCLDLVYSGDGGVGDGQGIHYGSGWSCRGARRAGRIMQPQRLADASLLRRSPASMC